MRARINFAFDKSELSSEAKSILDDKVQVLRNNKDMGVVMKGFTDVSGTDAYNMALGTRRAQSAKSYLVARGIDGNRIEIESYGKRQQIDGSTGAASEASNRRAVFEVLIGQDDGKLRTRTKAGPKRTAAIDAAGGSIFAEPSDWRIPPFRCIISGVPDTSNATRS